MTMLHAPKDRLSTPLEAYLHDIRDDALLTADEERSLAAAIARGDREARARMIRANLRLVVRIARDYTGRGLTLDDLVGEGNLGLIRATEEFDPAFGTRFSTYASYWIKQAIRQALMTTTATIRLPAHMVGLLGKWRKVERSLGRRLGRVPSPEEIADVLELTPAQRVLVDRALQARKVGPEGCGGADGSSWSTDEAADPHEAPEHELERSEERDELRRRLERLDERERMILTLRYGLAGAVPLTLKEVGRRLGVTREWVRKIEQRAVRKLDDRAQPTLTTEAVALRRRLRAVLRSA